MKEEDKNRKNDLNDFLRYTGKKITGRERNAFERELQKDPFEEEAAEGLSGISPGEALKDMAKLNRNLKLRVTRRQRAIYYSIAASVAVLMLISSVFYFTFRSKSIAGTSEIALNTTTPLEIAESKAISEPVKPSSETVATDRYEKPYKDKTSETIDKTGFAAGQKNEEISIAARKADVNEVDRGVADNLYNAEDKKIALVPAAVLARSEAITGSIKGRVISSEDNLPLPGVSVTVKGTDNGVLTDTEGNFSITVADKESQTLLASFIGMEPKEFKADADTQIQIQMEPSLLALNEVVVVGYGVSKSKKAMAYEEPITDDAEYSAPEPAGGQKEFDRFIENNMQKPVTFKEGEKAVVILNFIVSRNGTIDDIKIIRSQGEEFSREAIRLIREGPSWKPAMQNGEEIDDEVRVRIVFK